MSDEASEKPAEAAVSHDEETKEQNANNDAEIANSESTKEPSKKFSVNRVTFGPELSDSPEDTDDSKAPSESPEPKSPMSPEHFTFGYATNEAIPMTIFYRSQHSHSHSGKQRPTLQELRKGMENEKVGNHDQFITFSCLHVIIIMHMILSTRTSR